MPDPLDYRNAAAPQRAELTNNVPRDPRPAVPVEFDTVLCRTTDLAAARVIEDQLTAQGVGVFRADDAEAAADVPTVVLLIRPHDRERATAVASAIFARRQKVRSLLR